MVGATYGDRFATIATTLLFAAHQQRISEVLSRDACRETWRTIRQVVASILGGQSWTPKPSPFCASCPYFDNGCSAVPDDDPSAMTDWLSAAAAKSVL